jgi:uncharacterized metal-binding protein YceD (DUF177 family)
VAHHHAFYVKVADLEYGDHEIDEEIPVAWLEAAFAGSEAAPVGRPGRLTATVAKSGRDVMVRGRAVANVSMPCARTQDPVDVHLDAPIFLMLAPAGPRAHAAPRTRKQKGAAGKPPTKKRSGSPKAEAARESLDDADAARDTFDGEEVVLDDFVREFLMLELPMFPLRPDLRSDEATGISGPPIPEIRAEQTPREIDPRLAPLMDIRSRLAEKKTKKE